MQEALFRILADELLDWRNTCQTTDDIDYSTIQVAYLALAHRIEQAGLLSREEADELQHLIRTVSPA